MANTNSVRDTPASIPRTFVEYLRSFGPGLVVVLTWLGAGDIVESGAAGGNYGYSLIWVLVVAVAMRFLFVSLIAKYQLCNQHGEGVLDGLARLNPLYAPVLLFAAIVMGHVYGSYMTVGIGEACKYATGRGEVWQWALFWNSIALVLIFRSSFNRIESIFKFFLAVLSVSLIGTAVWVGINVSGILQGLISVEVPEKSDLQDPLLIATGMIGAVGGSLMNLVYPYFLQAKGWNGPQYRRVQLYDFLLAMVVMVVLNIAIWTLGAELLHTKGESIKKMYDLPNLLSNVLGRGGELLFYAGIFSAIFTSLAGHALGLAYMGTHAWLRWNAGNLPLEADFQDHPLYKFIAVWCLIPPLIWTAPGMPDFIALTLISNSSQVALLPLIAGGLWWITAFSKYIGPEYRNKWWENLVMAFLFVLAMISAITAVQQVAGAISSLTSTQTP